MGLCYGNYKLFLRLDLENNGGVIAVLCRGFAVRKKSIDPYHKRVNL